MLLTEPGVFIHGARWQGSGNGLQVEEPATGQNLASISTASTDDVALAVEDAASCFHGEWANTSPVDRAKLLCRFADTLDESAHELAALQSSENGKLIKEMLGQSQLFGDYLRYYAALCMQPTGYTTDVHFRSMTAHTVRMPLGVVAAITPWNSPLMLLLWKLGPALAAGNTVVVKPSEHTPLSTLALADLAIASGIPAGALNVVTGGPAVAQTLVRHLSVAKVAFTGSERAGLEVAQLAIAGLKRLTLELGGKSANVIFDDCDLDMAVKGAAAGIFGASGQTCMAGSRILVQRGIYDNFVEKFACLAEGLTVGDPLNGATDVGAIATAPQLEKIHRAVEGGIDSGARLVAGGSDVHVESHPKGRFYRPTVFVDADNSMSISQNEIFGPVATVIPFDSDQSAVEIANNTKYGLAAGLWTNSVQRANQVSRHLRAGTVWINNYRKTTYNVPFGGFGMSGIGRENGPSALNAYSEEKCIWTDLGEGIKDPFNPRA